MPLQPRHLLPHPLGVVRKPRRPLREGDIGDEERVRIIEREPVLAPFLAPLLAPAPGWDGVILPEGRVAVGTAEAMFDRGEVGAELVLQLEDASKRNRWNTSGTIIPLC